MIKNLTVVMTLLLSTGAVAQVSGVPTQITGTPPIQASNQIFNESARSYYSPGPMSTVNTIKSGWSAEKKAKLAQFHAEKLAREADRARSNPS